MSSNELRGSPISNKLRHVRGNKTSFEQTTFKRHHDSRFSINSNKCWTFKNYQCLLDQRKKGTVCIIDFVITW